MWYIFRQFRTKVPSIAAVKKFSLPGLVPPLKVLLYVKLKFGGMDIFLYAMSCKITLPSQIMYVQ